MKKVTIYEVAKEANVSLATVSRVINGSSIVKEETRKRVEDAISKLGYRPNAIAQGLALSRTTTVGLIIPSTSVSFSGRIINGLCDVAKIYDYSVFIHTITEGVMNVKEIIDEVIKSRVDGVIIYADKDLDDSVKLLEDYNIPMVVMGNKVSSDTICSVYVTITVPFMNCAVPIWTRGSKISPSCRITAMTWSPSSSEAVRSQRSKNTDSNTTAISKSAMTTVPHTNS